MYKAFYTPLCIKLKRLYNRESKTHSCSFPTVCRANPEPIPVSFCSLFFCFLFLSFLTFFCYSVLRLLNSQSILNCLQETKLTLIVGKFKEVDIEKYLTLSKTNQLEEFQKTEYMTSEWYLICVMCYSTDT